MLRGVWRRKRVILISFCGLLVGQLFNAHAQTHAKKASPTSSFQDVRVRLGTRFHHTQMDCSHFVNYVYRRAHFPYQYASSRELYDGVDEFQQVLNPLPGDLVVWKGHVGIVVDPSGNRFVSALRSGVKTDDYFSTYWKKRGTPRFLRYVGSSAIASAVREASQRNVKGASD